MLCCVLFDDLHTCTHCVQVIRVALSQAGAASLQRVMQKLQSKLCLIILKLKRGQLIQILIALYYIRKELNKL